MADRRAARRRPRSRWTADDSLWLRTRGRSPSIRNGKFNAGQKLNSLFVAGTLPLLLATGAVMRWFDPFPDNIRTGATFVHDLAAFGIWIAVTGHILKAFSEPVAMRSMISGWVPVDWARRHRPRWHHDVVGPGPDPADPDPAD
ncbi:MAG: cytochrome b/b6 domain-containing protein [Acidimicrobiales bacterium]